MADPDGREKLLIQLEYVFGCLKGAHGNLGRVQDFSLAFLNAVTASCHDSISKVMTAEERIIEKLLEYLKDSGSRGALKKCSEFMNADESAQVSKIELHHLSRVGDTEFRIRCFLRGIVAEHWKVVAFLKKLKLPPNLGIDDEATRIVNSLECMGKDFCQIFVCYAHSDKKCVEDTLKAMEKPMAQAHMKFWWDKELRPGDIWDDEIRKAIRRTDLGLLFLSSEFLGSEYIREVEAELMGTRRSKDMVICPVVLESKVVKIIETDDRLKWIAKHQMRPKNPTETDLRRLHETPADFAAFSGELAEELIDRMNNLAPTN